MMLKNIDDNSQVKTAYVENYNGTNISPYFFPSHICIMFKKLMFLTSHAHKLFSKLTKDLYNCCILHTYTYTTNNKIFIKQNSIAYNENLFLFNAFNAEGGINYNRSLVMCLEYGLSNRYFNLNIRCVKLLTNIDKHTQTRYIDDFIIIIIEGNLKLKFKLFNKIEINSRFSRFSFLI